METIIKKALKGGYEIKDIILKDDQMFAFNKMRSLSDVFKDSILDPLFWQALGKVCGWETKMDRFYCPDCEEKESSNWVFRKHCRECGKMQIQFLWLSSNWIMKGIGFHRVNLTEGWDKAVEYLQDLIK